MRPGTVSRGLAAGLGATIASLITGPPALAHTSACATAPRPITETSHTEAQLAVVCLVNQQRRGRGLPRLTENRRLDRAAQGWTEGMVAARMFSHGPDFPARITAVGFRWSSIGENIATGYASPAAVVAAWMASPGHCHNILDPTFRFVGTGVVDRPIIGYASGGGTWTQDFALRRGERAPSGNWGPADGCPYGAG